MWIRIELGRKTSFEIYKVGFIIQLNGEEKVGKYFRSDDLIQDLVCQQ